MTTQPMQPGPDAHRDAWTGVDPEIFTSTPARSPVIPGPPAGRAPRAVEMTIDGTPVNVPGDATIL